MSARDPRGSVDMNESATARLSRLLTMVPWLLTHQGVEIDAMFAHGGLFHTAGVAQRLLAAAIGAPVAVGHTAGEGGAWGIALLLFFPVLWTFLTSFKTEAEAVAQPEPDQLEAGRQHAADQERPDQREQRRVGRLGALREQQRPQARTYEGARGEATQ